MAEEKLRQKLCEAIAKHTPFSAGEIYEAWEKYHSFDLILCGVEYAREMGIASLKEAIKSWQGRKAVVGGDVLDKNVIVAVKEHTEPTFLQACEATKARAIFLCRGVYLYRSLSQTWIITAFFSGNDWLFKAYPGGRTILSVGGKKVLKEEQDKPLEDLVKELYGSERKEEK